MLAKDKDKLGLFLFFFGFFFFIQDRKCLEAAILSCRTARRKSSLGSLSLNHVTQRT